MQKEYITMSTFLVHVEMLPNGRGLKSIVEYVLELEDLFPIVKEGSDRSPLLDVLDQLIVVLTFQSNVRLKVE